MTGSREIPLTRGLVAIVDEGDFDWLNQWRWCASADGYAMRGVGYPPRTLLMHRLILAAPRGVLVDHANGNRADNRRCNIRLCTAAQNQWNVPAKPDSSVAFKGVKVSRGGSGYEARIACNGRREHLGTFRTPEEAARAYDEAARRLHGAFARVNFPEAA